MTYPFPITNDYYISIGETTQPGDDTHLYQIINKSTNVIEFETQVLPNAYSIIQQLQDSLDMAKGQDKEEKTADIRPIKLDS